MGPSPLSLLLPRSLPRSYYRRPPLVAPSRSCGTPRIIIGMVSLAQVCRLGMFTQVVPLVAQALLPTRPHILLALVKQGFLLFM